MRILRESEPQATLGGFVPTFERSSNGRQERQRFIHNFCDPELMSALHEAAQAVVAWALGLKVMRVEISPIPADEFNGILLGVGGQVTRESFAIPFCNAVGQRDNFIILECAILYAGPVTASRVRNNRLAHIMPIWQNDCAGQQFRP